MRPGRGHALGVNFIGPFKDHIALMFAEGESYKGKKVRAAQMREKIQRINPARYDITCTKHITAVSQGLVL